MAVRFSKHVLRVVSSLAWETVVGNRCRFDRERFGFPRTRCLVIVKGINSIPSRFSHAILPRVSLRSGSYPGLLADRNAGCTLVNNYARMGETTVFYSTLQAARERVWIITPQELSQWIHCARVLYKTFRRDATVMITLVKFENESKNVVEITRYLIQVHTHQIVWIIMGTFCEHACCTTHSHYYEFLLRNFFGIYRSYKIVLKRHNPLLPIIFGIFDIIIDIYITMKFL